MIAALLLTAALGMFKLVPNPTFTCPVRLSVPGTDQAVPVNITFKHQTARELDVWLKASRERENDADFLGDVILGWTGVAGADDKPVEYSKAALAQLLDAYPSAGLELLLAYRRQLADARAKN